MTRITTLALLGAASLALAACSGKTDAGNSGADASTNNAVVLNDDGSAGDTNFTAVDGALGDNAADPSDNAADGPIGNAGTGNAL